MIKLTFCLRRLPHLSRNEFQKYWRENHAPLVAKHAPLLKIQRYVQVHAGFDAINESARASRNAPEPFDGVAELWWESEAVMAENAGKPGVAEAAQELLDDERKFIDLERSPLWFNREHVIVG
jgi:uncharacterized protein (TIGR02118 family)